MADIKIGWSFEKIPISQQVSPSGEQPEHRKLAYELWQPTAGCIAIFQNFCCYTKSRDIRTNELYELIGGMFLMCQNTIIRV